VTLTATDAAGNSGTCSFIGNGGQDQTAPSITCPANASVAAGANCTATLASYTAAASASDNCTASPTTTQSPVSGTSISGSQVVTLTATDAAGNSGTCSFTVTVVDQTAPSITCPANASVVAGANCTATLASYTAAASASDNCTANPTTTQSPVAGTTISGSQVVTLTATDAAGNSGTCSFTVTVVDQTAPSITCPANASVAAGANCSATLASYTASAVASDNCTANPTKTQSPISGTTISGTQVVTLTATDAAGNSSTCSFAVTVVDQTAPSITCPANASVAAGANCSATLASYTASAVASDNCTANPTKTQSPISGTTISGTQVVTLTATDAAGNSSTCSFAVTVVDQTGPSLICKPATVNLNAVGTGSITTASVFQSGTDNCGTVNLISVAPSTFDCNNVGSNSVILSANDGNGNTGTCTAIVTVVDPIAPTILCKDVAISLDANGQATLSVAQVNNGSLDNCAIANLGISHILFTCANVGNNSVLLSGNDVNGNKGFCTATVTVLDPIAPMAKCKNLTANLGANGTVTIAASAVNNGSTDNCSVSVALTPGTFNCANVGANTVTLVATDGSGNTSTCTAIVTIRDLTAPTALCKNATVFLDINGEGTLSLSQVNNGSGDACGISSATLSNTQFDCSQISGTQMVTLTVKDQYNNSSSCTAIVTVRDNTAPTAICENTTVQLASNGLVAVYPSDLASESFDNCSVWSYSPTAKVYKTANVGINNLTITVKDWSNNASTCVSIVTVLPYVGINGDDSNRSVFEAVDLDVQLFPNPTTGDANLVFALPDEQAFTLMVFDMSGRMVLHQKGIGQEGDNALPIRLGGIAPGVYIVDFQTDVLKTKKRLVVQE
jgi:hypothetical protein